MRMKVSIIIIVVVSALVFGSFMYSAFWAQSKPRTHRAFSATDVVGCWRFTDGNIVMTTNVNGDGTFAQYVREGNSAPLRHLGTWSLDRDSAVVVLSDALQRTDARWQPKREVMWFIVDSSHKTRSVAISGGFIPDPDFFREMIVAAPGDVDCESGERPGRNEGDSRNEGDRDINMQ
jgi:hypothetical protein